MPTLLANEFPAVGSGKDAAALVSESDSRHSTSPLPSSSEGQRSLLVAPQLHPCNNNEGERSIVSHEGEDPNKG